MTASDAATNRSEVSVDDRVCRPARLAGVTAMILTAALLAGIGCSGPSEPPADPETFGAGQVLIDALGGTIKRTLTPIDPFGHGRIERNYWIVDTACDLSDAATCNSELLDRHPSFTVREPVGDPLVTGFALDLGPPGVDCAGSIRPRLTELGSPRLSNTPPEASDWQATVICGPPL